MITARENINIRQINYHFGRHLGTKLINLHQTLIIFNYYLKENQW
jgi:hypothetical protein